MFNHHNWSVLCLYHTFFHLLIHSRLGSKIPLHFTFSRVHHLLVLKQNGDFPYSALCSGPIALKPHIMTVSSLTGTHEFYCIHSFIPGTWHTPGHIEVLDKHLLNE